MPDPVRPADAEARALAQGLLALGHAALAWTDPATGTPGISRIAFARDRDEGMLTLVSALAPHFRALRENPDCALMLGEVGAKGDPMTHPRLMIRARAGFVAPDDPARAERVAKAEEYAETVLRRQWNSDLASGLIWRALLVCLFLLTLVSLAGW